MLPKEIAERVHASARRVSDANTHLRVAILSSRPLILLLLLTLLVSESARPALQHADCHPRIREALACVVHVSLAHPTVSAGLGESFYYYYHLSRITTANPILVARR
jgi:hypothetical protein